MINSNYNVNSTPLKYNKSFGRGPAPQVFDISGLSEEQKAEKMKEFAEKIKESDKGPSAARSFAIVAALTAASALTGAAISGRFFNIFNQLGLLKKVTPKVSTLIETTSQNLKNSSVNNGVKGKVVAGLTDVFGALEKNSVYGVEEKLSKLNARKANKIKAIRKALLAQNPALKQDKEALAEAINNAIKENKDYQKFFKDIEKQIADVKGTNISRKATKTAAATFMGVGALREASRDEDKNGVPDCVEYAHAQKKAAQKVSAAILDCALDTI